MGTYTDTMQLSWRQRNELAFGANCLFTYGIGTGMLGAAMMHRLGLRTNKEISQSWPTLVTPKGWAFAIWGPIFLGEAALTVFQSMDRASPHTELLRRISPAWQLTCVAQSLWTVAFARDNMIVSTPLFLVIGGALLHAYSDVAASELPGVAYWCVHVPLAMHCSWVCCALVVQTNLAAAKHFPSKQGILSIISILTAGLG